MREIKFRAFNTKTGKMVDLYKITPLATAPEFEQDGLFIPFDEDYKLMQYTGLKDKNGVDIYEGDIINYIFGPSEVKFDDGCYFVHGHPQTINTQPLGNLIARQCEIIGNIYENPELLKKI